VLLLADVLVEFEVEVELGLDIVVLFVVDDELVVYCTGSAFTIIFN
jgi:hypothetical protein